VPLYCHSDRLTTTSSPSTCQTAFKIDPRSAPKIAPTEMAVLRVTLEVPRSKISSSQREGGEKVVEVATYDVISAQIGRNSGVCSTASSDVGDQMP
jgi:hypothetical protein